MRRDLKRGVLFETAAEKDEKFRPTYALGVVDRLVEAAGLSAGSRVLEIGCGTGKATRLFAPKGFWMDCVDLGTHLVSIAPAICKPWPNVRFTVAKVEDVPLEAGAYNLVFAAQAFHWIDPATRWKRCHDALAPGGTMALLYNWEVRPSEGPQWELSELIKKLSDDAMPVRNHEEELQDWIEEMTVSGLFTAPQTIREKWIRRDDFESYMGTFETYSDHMVLGPKMKADIREAVVDAIRKNGGVWEAEFETVAIHARKAAGAVSP